MSSAPLNDADVRNAIVALAEEAGGQKALAERLGISPAYLNDILMARRGFSDAVLAKLGLQRVTTYRRLDATQGRAAR